MIVSVKKSVSNSRLAQKENDLFSSKYKRKKIKIQIYIYMYYSVYA